MAVPSTRDSARRFHYDMPMINSRWQLLVTSLVLVGSTSAGVADDPPPNPYGIAGYGVLDDLGMPADSLHYDWNNLRADNSIQMCRPNHYYNFIGIPVRWWGFNEQTGEINDPVQFDQWVRDHPGKIWMIGNEPDLGSQDGLTREQYALMYKTYYDFISQRDATARFCIGAATGGSTTAALNRTKDWYGFVLDYYETTFGVPMHIDVWNVHSYVGPVQIEDPDQPIRDFIDPFVTWCRTLDEGRYANAEFWISELPVGEWMGALSEEWIIWFAERYLPRLERTGVDRWFWFVSRGSGEWATVALVKGSTVSPLGQAYAVLANNFPNDIIPVSPFEPDPTPNLFDDDFSSGPIDDPWMIKAGLWTIEDSVLRQSRRDYQWRGETCVLQYIYDDFDAMFQMRVNDQSDANNWAGVSFRVAGRFHAFNHSGYLVYLRANGAVGLHNQIDGTMQEVVDAVGDASAFQRFRVQMVGPFIRVWVNGEKMIEYTDTANRFSRGYTVFQVLKTDSSFDELKIWNAPNSVPAIDSSSIDADWLIADGATPYTVKVTSHDADAASEIVMMQVLLDDGTLTSEEGRGVVSWGVTDEQILAEEGDWTLMGDATGGGRWAWRSDAWGGDAYITPIAVAAQHAGNQRTICVTFTAKPAWAGSDEPRFHAKARDLKGDETSWVLSSAKFSVHAAGPGDADGDGDVDQSDFGALQACYTGPGIAQPEERCFDARLDSDEDVDADDFGIFQNCMTGPGNPADPNCRN